ncbi:MAG: hypothetical protein WDN46_16030 [Methylocella sp.]
MLRFWNKWLAPFSYFESNAGHAIGIKTSRLADILYQSHKETRRHETDAMDLIAKFAGQAYYEADQLSKGYGVSDQPRSHWARVKIEIARRREVDAGLSGSMQWD